MQVKGRGQAGRLRRTPGNEITPAVLVQAAETRPIANANSSVARRPPTMSTCAPARRAFTGCGNSPTATWLRTTLVVPLIGVRSKPGKSVMLCWNASRESARAAAEALPFLVAADKVVVLIIDPKTSAAGHGAEPGADVASWLARHGVNVTVQRDVAADADVGSVILSRAADHDIDLIVMGIYGHSRLREVILGGASRTLLSSMTVPVLMAH
jgi:nucleotide-binding universal stress UspA family protein